uniref:C2H2-type domain-containing protein n=1 Tax=Clastoptera arizonana TaxID=38151 RepID=A0A1B6DJK0_9HEMI
MEVQGDHSLLVVSLENCISSDGNRQLGKSNSCIYTAAMSNNSCSHETSVVHIAAQVQAYPRLQHQHLTQLQPIQYPQAVSYENQQLHQHSNIMPGHTLYQPMNVSTGALHHYSPHNQPLHNPYINTAQALHLTPVPLQQTYNHAAPALHIETTQIPDSHLLATNNEVEQIPEATFPEDDFQYYREIQCFLTSEEIPHGASDNYKKHLRKRAQHYSIIDGKLYHGRKQPKLVVMNKEDQQEMLKNIHIIKETGVHLGVKKMFNELHVHHFWRGMYIDVVSFVKNCDKCSDVVDVVRRRQAGLMNNDGEDMDEEEEDVEDPLSLSPKSTNTMCLRPRSQNNNNNISNRVWKKVEVHLLGPFKKTCNKNEFIVSISDPESHWVCAKAIPGNGHPTHMAEFIFHTFCNYGFPLCVLVGVSSDLSDAVSEEYSSRVKCVGENFGDISLTVVDSQESQCFWVDSLFHVLIQAHPIKWDKELDNYLFLYRTGKVTEFVSTSTVSPFSCIFNHDPINICSPDEDKENNIEGTVSRRRKLQSSILQCRHCDEIFTSKISFRIHQRKHTEDAQERGREAGEVIRRIRRSSGRRRRNVCQIIKSSEEEVQFKPPNTWVESTVSAVKALLVATKEERRRRGKYHKYTSELQEQMAMYAVKHGNPQAVRYFSERLGTVVSESTIRNLVKVHISFTPLLKEEIGRFAANFGVEAAARYFSDRLKRDVSQSLVRKFKTLYLNKLPDNTRRLKDKNPKKERKKKGIIYKKSAVNGSNKIAKRYSLKVKDDIGIYACHHSVPETVQYFSEKFQILVKERTVKRFHKAYLEKCQQATPIENNQMEATHVEHIHSLPQPANVYNTAFTHHVNNTPTTMYPISQCPNGNNLCYQSQSTASVIMTQSNSTFNYHTMNPIPPPPQVYPLQPTMLRQTEQQTQLPTLSVPEGQEQINSSCLMSQHSLIVEERNGPIMSHFMAPTPHEQQNIKHDNMSRNHLPTDFIADTYQQPDVNIPIVTELLTETQKQETQLENDRNISKKEELIKSEERELNTHIPITNNKKHVRKKESNIKKRGSYTTYSPELRAEIGKYAAEHGSLKACHYFSKILGHDVPESTARGLKDKYLMKRKHCTVTSLGYSQRGRPLRLGKYDEVVQECLKELVRSGEKVSSFLAITTAKQILNKYDPGLLDDNGGPVKLNTTWAKSFLKRIGVHNNS